MKIIIPQTINNILTKEDTVQYDFIMFIENYTPELNITQQKDLNDTIDNYLQKIQDIRDIENRPPIKGKTDKHTQKETQEANEWIYEFMEQDKEGQQENDNTDTDTEEDIQ